MLYGRTAAAMPSRFIKEIPEDIVVKKGGYTAARSYNTGFESSYTKPTYVNPYLNYAPSTSVKKVTEKPSYLELNKGDMVNHTAFGKGLVLSVMKMGGDALLEIAFDQIGTKKLMAKTASAHLKKL